MANRLKKEHHRIVSLTAGLIFLCLVAGFNLAGQKEIKRQQFCSSQRAVFRAAISAEMGDKLEAKAVHVQDFTTENTIYSKNGTAELPLASLTKLMTVRVALKTISQDSFYTVTEDDVLFDGPTGFISGDKYPMRDLLAATLIASSNNAATMVAKSTGVSLQKFISLMNFEAQNLGLLSLRYASVSGLDTENLEPTATGSASDIVKLIYKNTIDMPEVMEQSTLPVATIRATNGRSINLENTDDDIGKLGLLKASKTGYTIAAGGNLAVVWQEPGGDMIGAAVLGSSVSGRFTDMLLLHDAADRYAASVRTLPEYCR